MRGGGRGARDKRTPSLEGAAGAYTISRYSLNISELSGIPCSAKPPKTNPAVKAVSTFIIWKTWARGGGGEA